MPTGRSSSGIEVRRSSSCSTSRSFVDRIGIGMTNGPIGPNVGNNETSIRLPLNGATISELTRLGVRVAFLKSAG